MLLLRGSRWYYRCVIPVDLRPLVGKREIVKALGTTDHEQAKLLSLRVGQEVDRQLQALRKRTRPATTPDDLARLLESRTKTADANHRATRVLETTRSSGWPTAERPRRWVRYCGHG
jgi:hypothetical protein